MRWLGLAVVLVFVMGACGEPPGQPPIGRPTPGEEPSPEEWGPDQLFVGTGLVLDEGDGPIFCLSGVEESLPPQCGGPEIRGWSWKDVEHEEAAGVRWGDFTLTGTYVEGIFTLEGEPEKPEPFEGGGDSVDVPCDEPSGGWERPDPDKTSEEDLQNAIQAAEAEPDSAGAWIDYIIEPQTEAEMVPQGENIVLVLAFTGDAERHEVEAREHWGGALCIWLHERTQKELRHIQGEVGDTDWSEWGVETTWSNTDITTGIVSVGVIVSPPGWEEELDRRYGEGVVQVVPALRPVD